jgi:hypothetical protein
MQSVPIERTQTQILVNEFIRFLMLLRILGSGRR